MFLQSFCKCHCIKISVGGCGILEGFVVFLLDIEFIESIIDSFNVSRLDRHEVGFDKRDIIRLFEHSNDTSMIDTWSENGEKICEKSWMFLEIKVERSVVNLQIRCFDNDLLERVVFLMLVILGKIIPKSPQNVPSLQEQHYRIRHSECTA